MAHMAPRTFAINPGTLAIPVLPSKILPQRVAESVQQIRFAANGVRLPTQSLDQIDERVFLFSCSGCKVHYSSRGSFRPAACMS